VESRIDIAAGQLSEVVGSICRKHPFPLLLLLLLLEHLKREQEKKRDRR
jgi:hypothetical protein